MTLRVGLGFDSHHAVAGRPLILGGVTVPADFGLAGHSDADVLTHAVIDALLGAAGLGNIGQWFPDDVPAYKDADSLGLLRRVAGELHRLGWSLVNLDTVVVADQPRLGPFLDPMRRHLADALGAPPEAIGVKPKTPDALGGPLGDGQGIGALAVVLLTREATAPGG